MMISRIKTNLVFGSEESFALTNRTLLQGRNGQGKTMLLNALRLALVGTAQDLAGKDHFAVVKSGSELIKLGDIHRSPSAKVIFESGDQCSWSIVAGKRASHSKPSMEVVYPLDEAIGAVRGGVDTRIAFFAKNFLDEEEAVDRWDHLRLRVREFKKEIKEYQTTLDTLSKLYTADIKAGFVGAAVHLLEAKENSNQTKCPVCATDIGSLESRLESLKSSADILGSPRPDLRVLKKAMEAIQTEVTELETEAKRIKTRLYNSIVGECDFITARVNDYIKNSSRKLTDQFEFALELENNKFDMGLRRRSSGRLYKYASGAQWIILALGICGVLTERYSKNGCLCVTVIPDRGYDHTTSRVIISVADRLEGAVIFPRPLKLPGRQVQGWSVLDLDDLSFRWRDRIRQETANART